MRSLKIFLILGLVILLIGFTFSCKGFKNPLGPSDPNDNGDDNGDNNSCLNYPPVGQIGEWVESCYYGLKVTKVKKTTQRIGEDHVPKKNHYFLIISLRIKNIGAKNEPHVSTWHDFKITDSQGRNYRQENSRNNSLTLSLKNPIYYDEFLLLGKEIKGDMAFEIPDDATGLILCFRPQVQNTELKVDLGI